jgi:hypothetical protein
MMKLLPGFMSLLLISGCHPVVEQNRQPLWWDIDFIGPSYMLGEVELHIVEDINGKLFRRSGGGPIGTDTPEDGTESARGWPRHIGGSILPVTGAALPKRIFVRWQSITEPQTYKVWVDIPEQAREVMRATTSQPCSETHRYRYGASLTLGLAPGGVAQVWTDDSCHRAIKVARAQAEVEPLGPSQGKNEGRYAYTLDEKVQRYIERYGIPYGSW